MRLDRRIKGVAVGCEGVVRFNSGPELLGVTEVPLGPLGVRFASALWLSLRLRVKVADLGPAWRGRKVGLLLHLVV